MRGSSRERPSSSRDSRLSASDSRAQWTCLGGRKPPSRRPLCARRSQADPRGRSRRGICRGLGRRDPRSKARLEGRARADQAAPRTRASSRRPSRSEEHTSELQSHVNLVCRLLLEKKKNTKKPTEYTKRNNNAP